ncbi:MAG: cysteine desulfurase family protein [Rhodospirillaceae bacterium]
MSTDPNVYLDYNATAPARAEVIEAVAETLGLGATNASSVHASGGAARKLIEAARASVAALAGATPEQVIFTSGGTEANNAVLGGAGRPRILVSAVEHSAVLRTALVRAGDCEVVPVDADGVIRLDKLDELLAADGEPALVSVMAANNETGALQPVAEVARIARAHGALMHSDAVQAAGKIAIDLGAWNADFLTLSAHKIGGPQGVGAVIARDAQALRPMILGGGQERGRRAGTENTAGIAGFGVAAELAVRELERSAAHMLKLRDALEARLAEAVPGMTIFAGRAKRLPNTSCFTMPGVRNDTQVMALDLAGYEVSAGSACSAGKVEPSHVLEAMGAADADAIQAIRVSLGGGTRAEDVNGFAEAWLELWSRKGAGRATASDAA